LARIRTGEQYTPVRQFSRKGDWCPEDGIEKDGAGFRIENIILR
jgi:hypothetical protein